MRETERVCVCAWERVCVCDYLGLVRGCICCGTCDDPLTHQPQSPAPLLTLTLTLAPTLGFVVAIPPIITFFWGRNHVFKYMARKFDAENAENDGAFVAELLATATASVGEPWWIMRKEPLDSLPENGP